MTDGNDAAHPEIFTDIDRNNPKWGGDTYSTGGLTKREYFAGLAMQGLLSCNATYNGQTSHRGKLTADAVAHADELIEALNTEEKHDDGQFTRSGT